MQVWQSSDLGPSQSWAQIGVSVEDGQMKGHGLPVGLLQSWDHRPGKSAGDGARTSEDGGELPEGPQEGWLRGP